MSKNSSALAFLTGGGIMAERIAAYDWDHHPMGPIAQWPASLRTTLSIILNSRTPKYLAWGSDYFSFYNDAYIPQLGLKTDALGRRFPDVWAEAWDVVGPIANRAFAGEGCHFEDMPIVTERGGFPETSYFTFSYSPVRDADGVVAGVLCTTLDVTANVLALQQSQAVEERLQLSLEASGNIGTWTVDLEDNRTYLDQRFARLFGVDPATARAGPKLQYFIDLIHPADRDRVAAQVQDAIASGAIFETEYRIPQQSGAQVWVMVTGKIFADVNTGRRRFAGVAVDITERRLSEQALRNSEAKFRTIADAMPQMVWSTLPDGYHDYYNQQWYEYTGMPFGSTDGEAWNGMFHPEDQERAWSRWSACLASGDVYEIEYRLRHHSGEYRWVLGRALPVRGEHGEIIRWMGTCTDIHASKQAQDELRRTNRQKDEFLAMLAHELRNPLAPISTSAQLLGMPNVNPATIKRASEVIARQVSHMTSLVDDLLDVSRVTRGLVSVAREPCDMKSIIASALEQTRPILESRGHTLSVVLPDDAVFVFGDRNRLVQVIANLVSNSAKYTPQHGRIAVTLEGGPVFVSLSVVDNGSGIDAELLPHVFDLFTQGHRTPDRSQGGLGLGLALVKNIVALHDGSVTAYSEGNGKGSEFAITLPRIMPEQGRGDAVQEQGAALKPLSIMLVDDNVDAVQTLAALLQSDGHTVSVHTEGASALDMARGGHVDVFILDIGLPDIDGYELVRRLRALPGPSKARCIALTGYGQSHDRGLALAAGFDHHCIKPIDIDELRRILQQVELGGELGVGTKS